MIWYNLQTKYEQIFSYLLLVCAPIAALALFQEVSLARSPTPPPGKKRDGQHDFDFNIGT